MGVFLTHDCISVGCKEAAIGYIVSGTRDCAKLSAWWVHDERAKIPWNEPCRLPPFGFVPPFLVHPRLWYPDKNKPSSILLYKSDSRELVTWYSYCLSLRGWVFNCYRVHGIRRRWSNSTRRGRYLLIQFRCAIDLIPTIYAKTEQKSTERYSTSAQYRARAETSKVGLTNRRHNSHCVRPFKQRISSGSLP